MSAIDACLYLEPWQRLPLGMPRRESELVATRINARSLDRDPEG